MGGQSRAVGTASGTRKAQVPCRSRGLRGFSVFAGAASTSCYPAVSCRNTCEAERATSHCLVMRHAVDLPRNGAAGPRALSQFVSSSLAPTSALSNSAESRAACWPVLLLFCAGFVPKLYGLDRQSLWLDEVASLGVAELPWGQLIQGDYFDIHPPLYFLILKPFVLLSERLPEWRDFLVRLPAALAAGGLAVAVLRLGSLCGGALTGWVAALSSLLSAFVFYHGQECRMYTLAMLLLVIQSCAVLRAAEKPEKRGLWIQVVVATLLAVFTHWFVICVWPGVVALALSRSRSRQVLKGLSLVTLSLVAAVSCFWAAKIGGFVEFYYWTLDGLDLVDVEFDAEGQVVVSAVSEDASKGPSVLVRLLMLTWGLWAGHGIGPTDIGAGNGGVVEKVLSSSYSLGLASFAALAALVIAVVSLRRFRDRSLIWALLFWAALAVAVPAILTDEHARPRHAFAGIPPLLILVAIAVNAARQLGPRLVLVAACLSVQVAACWQQLHDESRWHPDFRAVADLVRARKDLHSGFVCQAHLAVMLAAYGADDALGFRYEFGGRSGESTVLDWMSERVARGLPVGLLTNARWSPLHPATTDRLAADFELVEQEQWGEVRLQVYKQAPR